MDHFTRDGLVFDVRDGGDGRAGTVVALHGFPQTGAMWEPVRAAWEEAGHRVVAPDQRGYSPGARPPGIRPYTQRELAADAVALIEALDAGPVHLVGHDWGGAVAWTVAYRRPDLLRSLTVLSTPHPLAYRAGLLQGQALKSWYFLAFQPPRLPERTLSLRGGEVFARSLRGSGLDASSAARTVELFRQPGAATAAVNWYRALRFGAPAAGRIQVRTLYVWGDRDRFLGAAPARRTGSFVDAPYEYAEIRGGTHWLVEQRPGQVADLVLEHLAHA